MSTEDGFYEGALRRSEFDPGVLQALFHDLREDHVQTGVDLLDHVDRHPGLPDMHMILTEVMEDRLEDAGIEL